MKETKKDKDFWLDDAGFFLSEEYHEEIVKPEEAAKKRSQREKKCILPDGTRCKRKTCEGCPKGEPSGSALSYDRLVESRYEIPGDSDVAAAYENQELLLALASGLAALTSNQHRIFTALHIDNKTEREVAKELGVSQNTVNYHDKRIREILQKLLKKYL